MLEDQEGGCSGRGMLDSTPVVVDIGVHLRAAVVQLIDVGVHRRLEADLVVNDLRYTRTRVMETASNYGTVVNFR